MFLVFHSPNPALKCPCSQAASKKNKHCLCFSFSTVCFKLKSRNRQYFFMSNHNWIVRSWMAMLEWLHRSLWRNAGVLFCQRGCNLLLLMKTQPRFVFTPETFLQAVHQLSRGAACRRTPCLREQTLYSLLLGDKSSILGLAKTGSITRGLGESSRVVINHSHGDLFRQGSAEGEGVKPAAEHVSSRRWQTKTLCHGTIEESGKLRPRLQWDGNSVPSTGWFPIPSPCGLYFILFLFF